MAQLTVDVEEDVIQVLEARASRNGRTAEAEVREILREVLMKPRPSSMSFKDHLASMPEGLTDDDLARSDDVGRDVELD